MSEMFTLRAAYSDIMQAGNDNGDDPMSWDQVVALTHKEDVMLRPTLPRDLDRSTARLVHDCWAHDPSLRPSFPVILVRLQMIERSRIAKSVGDQRAEDLKSMRSFFRSVHDLVWLFNSQDWTEQATLSLLDPQIAVTAANETLRKVLGSETGPRAVKNLGWMMFGGLEDRAEIIPEPLLDEDIVLDLERGSGMVFFRFAVKPPKKRIQWVTADTKEFDALGLALAEMEKELETNEDEALYKAVAESKADAKARRRKVARKRRPQRPARPRKNKEVTRFMKAAKFVRGMGACEFLYSATAASV